MLSHLISQLPAFIRPLVQLVLWCWVIIGPGMGLAALLVRGKRVGPAGTMALVLACGLMAMPLAAQLYVVLSGTYLTLPFLLVGGLVLNTGTAVLWQSGIRVELVRPSWLLVGGMALVAAIALFTYDPWLLFSNIAEYARFGAGDCFRRGTFRYIGFLTPFFAEPESPMGPNWDGVVRGNVALSGTHVLLLGTSGFRVLRVLVMELLALLGWALGERVGGRKAAVTGLLFLALNPFVVMIHELDRNVIALAWGALLYYLLEERVAGPIVLGMVVGFAAGLGLNLLPLVFLLPVTLTLVRRRTAAWRCLVMWLLALLLAGLWLANIGLPPAVPRVAAGESRESGGPPPPSVTEEKAGDHGPIWGRAPDALTPPEPFVYKILGLRLELDRALAWPWGEELVRAASDPWPPWLYYLLHLGRMFGALFLGLAALGLVRAWRSDRWGAVTLVLWGVPTWALLALQAYLLQPEQLRVQVNGLLPVLLLAVGGAVGVLRRPLPWRELLLWGALSLACAAGHWGLASVEVPVSNRLSEALRETVGDKGIPEGYTSMDRPAATIRQEWLRPMLFPNYLERLYSSRAMRREVGEPRAWLDVRHNNLWEYAPSWSERIGGNGPVEWEPPP